MGQSSSSSTSAPQLTAEQLSLRLAELFAHKCFTSLELYCFRDNFRTLADTSTSEGGFLYWKEDTLIRFLSLPADPDVGPIIFQAVSNLAAFPFPSLAPAILNYEALLKVVTLLTGRYKKALKREPDIVKLLFRAFAVHDRASPGHAQGEKATAEGEHDDRVYDSDGSEDLALDELVGDAKGSIPPDTHGVRGARIPLDNMRKLIMLLLVIAPLEENQPLADFADQFAPDNIDTLKETAECVLRGFGKDVDAGLGISYRAFRKALRSSMPHLFNPGLSTLFLQFLYSKTLTPGSRPATASSTTSPLETPETALQPPPPRPPLLPNPGQILTLPRLQQLSLFLPRLFSHLHPLYAGSTSGFSLGSLEKSTTKWNAPTIFLLSGTVLPTNPTSQPARHFLDLLPPSRSLPSTTGPKPGEAIILGVYLPMPWKHSHKTHFGSPGSILFHLSPSHRTFRASTTNTDYAYFNRDDGVGFGAPLQQWKATSTASRGPFYRLGPVSLVVDHSGMEYAVFTHQGRGGAFYADEEEAEYRVVMEVEEMEVWGVGGDEERERMRREWKWEEREALARRGLRLGQEREADRALLEMAGLIGQNRSGGSMG